MYVQELTTLDFYSTVNSVNVKSVISIFTVERTTVNCYVTTPYHDNVCSYGC